MSDLLSKIDGYEPEMIEVLKSTVNIDSGRDCPEGIKQVAEIFGGKMKEFGFEVEYLDYPGFTTHVIGRRKSSNPNAKKVMVIGHMDTVFSKGAAAERPFKIVDGKGYGPGVLDMKSGITIGIFACRALAEVGTDVDMTLFFCGDEESGHPNSDAAKLFEEFAKDKDACFNMETGADNGTVVVGRRGCMYPEIHIQGIASHSGKDPEKGASAIQEMALKITDMYKINNPDEGIAYNAGKIYGGIVANGIAAECHCLGDFRFKRMDQYDYIMNFAKEVCEKNYNPRTKTTLVIDEHRTFIPMEQTEGNMKLYEIVKAQGEKLGIDVQAIYVGAGADSCYTVKGGAPTVCAMGARGELNHSENEYIHISSLTERAKLLALTIQNV